MMIRFFILLLLLQSTVYAQQATSTLRGVIKDEDSKLPLTGATISLIGTETGTTSATDGSFRFDKLAVGRYNVKVSYIGYKTIVTPEILVESAKENVISISLTYSDTTLSETTVHFRRSENLNNVHEITNEQTLRYASTYLDPARVATSLPGVAAADDQANGLVVRGNNPNNNSWRLEGVEIVNPNHLSNAGTFGDRATQTGGGVNILSTQLLSTTNFLTGAYASSYGNALGGIIDMYLRKGNDQKAEHTAQIGLIGVDLSTEGPFSKNGKASYLANYRYSFTGLLGAMGVKFGGEEIGFQDLSFNVHLPTKKAGDFTIFGIGGTSKNTFESDSDHQTWEDEKDTQNINYSNKMGAAGITHSMGLGKHSSWNSTIAFSALETDRNAYYNDIIHSTSSLGFITSSDLIKKNKLSVATAFTHRFNEKHRFKVGSYLTHDNDQIAVNENAKEMEGTLVQPYLTWQWALLKNVRTEIGFHYMYYSYNRKSSAEPRAALRWDVSPKSTISLAYGAHSKTQTAQTYLSVGAKVSNNNHLLDLTRSKHYSAGYEHRFSYNSILKVEAYYQELSNVPVGTGTNSAFSILNAVENNIIVALQNKGAGKNQGIEASFQKFLTNDFYLLLSGSIYESKYKGVTVGWNNTRFNGSHTFSLTTGKEFTLASNSMVGVNLKALWLGGFRDTPIDETASAAQNTTVYKTTQSYTIKMKDYFRPDLRVYWKKNHEKMNTTLAIDIQNVSSTKNEAYSYYDTYQKSIVSRKQLGIVPMISYRVEF